VQTDYNTLIDHDLFANASGSFFSGYTPSGYRMTETDVKISLYDSVFLAFAMGNFDYDAGEFVPTWYGWAELTYNGSLVSMLNSAVAATPFEGIYAGTGITTPEPSSALLILCGISALCLRRRRIL